MRRTTTTHPPRRAGVLRAAGLAAACVGVLGLTACSGDDDASSGSSTDDPSGSASDGGSPGAGGDGGGADGGASEGGSASATPGEPGTSLPGDASTGETLPPLEGADCDATVQVTGGAQASWSGTGDAITGEETGAPAVYETQDGAFRVTVTAAGLDFDAAVILTEAGGLSYGSGPGATGIDVAADGSGGTVDVEVVAPELPDQVARVRATFTC